MVFFLEGGHPQSLDIRASLNASSGRFGLHNVHLAAWLLLGALRPFRAPLSDLTAEDPLGIEMNVHARQIDDLRRLANAAGRVVACAADPPGTVCRTPRDARVVGASRKDA